MKNFFKKIISDKYLMMSITITCIIIAAILIITFTKFKQLPFIYNEF